MCKPAAPAASRYACDSAPFPGSSAICDMFTWCGRAPFTIARQLIRCDSVIPSSTRIAAISPIDHASSRYLTQALRRCLALDHGPQNKSSRKVCSTPSTLFIALASVRETEWACTRGYGKLFTLLILARQGTEWNYGRLISSPNLTSRRNASTASQWWTRAPSRGRTPSTCQCLQIWLKYFQNAWAKGFEC